MQHTQPDLMPPYRAKGIALAYLCGVEKADIKQRWEIASAVLDPIIGQINLTEQARRNVKKPPWDEELIRDYCRVRSQDGSERNAVHLYLTYPEQENKLAPGIDCGSAYYAVKVVIFDPRNEAVVKETGLEGKIKSLRKDSGVLELLQDIFYGTSTSYSSKRDLHIALQFARQLAYQRLQEAYLRGGALSLDDVYAQVAKDIPVKVEEHSKWRSAPRLPELIQELLGTLKSRKMRGKDVINGRYSLLGGERKTLEQIGIEFGVVGEQIRSDEAKALRQLRHPSRSDKIAFLLGIDNPRLKK